MTGGMSWPLPPAAVSMPPASSGLEAHLFHEGDGQCSDGRRVGHPAAGDGAHEGARHDRDLGRPALGVPHEGHGQLHEILPGAGPFKNSPEEHEGKHEGGGDPQRNPEDALPGQVEVVDDAAERVAAMGEDPRHVGAEKAVQDENAGDDHQGQPHGPARGFQDQDDGQDSHREVHGRRVADPLDQLFIKYRHIDDDPSRHGRQEEVEKRDGLAFRLLRQRVKKKAQGDGECQVHGTLEGSGQHAEKGGVNLETGKGYGDQEGDLKGNPGKPPLPEFLLLHHLFGFFHQGFVANDLLFHAPSRPSVVSQAHQEIGISAHGNRDNVSRFDQVVQIQRAIPEAQTRLIDR